MTSPLEDWPASLGSNLKIESPWRIDGTADLHATPDTFLPPGDESFDDHEEDYKKQLRNTRKKLGKLQRVLFAGKQYSVLMIFQALDAAGKDGAIREVLEGLDPASVEVAAFKKPSVNELAHDFLWRTSLKLPPRGKIGAFNRSYYEEVLAVRVHPEFLDAQFPGNRPELASLWEDRFSAIRAHEHHLAASRTIVLKFWLNVSPGRQARRFLDRLEDPEKHWKYSSRDVMESGLRAKYDEALLHMLNKSSTPHAPWFCVPADNRWYLRAHIADILHQALSQLPLSYPSADLPAGDELIEVSEILRKRVESESAG